MDYINNLYKQYFSSLQYKDVQVQQKIIIIVLVHMMVESRR